MRNLILLATLLFAATQTRAASKIVSTDFEARFCGKAQAKAIFGVEAEACYVINSKRGNDAWVRFCGGFSPSVGAEAMGIGVKGEIKALGCFYVRYAASTTLEEFEKHLNGSGAESKKDRELLLRKAKDYFRSLPEDKLKEFGIERRQLDLWKSIEFKKFQALPAPLDPSNVNKKIQQLKTPKAMKPAPIS